MEHGTRRVDGHEFSIEPNLEGLFCEQTVKVVEEAGLAPAVGGFEDIERAGLKAEVEALAGGIREETTGAALEDEVFDFENRRGGR